MHINHKCIIMISTVTVTVSLDTSVLLLTRLFFNYTESKEPKTEPEDQATADVSESPAEIGSTPADSKPEDQSTKDETPEETTDVEPPPPSEDELLPWLPDIELVDHTNNTVSKERIASADVLAVGQRSACNLLLLICH